jgi:hypothetical protein
LELPEKQPTGIVLRPLVGVYSNYHSINVCYAINHGNCKPNIYTGWIKQGQAPPFGAGEQDLPLIPSTLNSQHLAINLH